MTLTHLGKLLGCSRQNVKKLAEALQRKGFVSLHPSAADSRAAVIEATSAAEEYFNSMGALFQQRLKQLFADFSDAETEQFFRMMIQFMTSIDNLEGEIQ